MKKIILCIFVVTITIVNLFVARDENNKRIKIVSTELLALAEGEHYEESDYGEIGEGEYDNGNSNSPCLTTQTNSLSFQSCEIDGTKVQVLSRRDVSHSCNGTGSGTCTQGHIYEFFDCMGMMVGSNDFTHIKQCQ